MLLKAILPSKLNYELVKSDKCYLISGGKSLRGQPVKISSFASWLASVHILAAWCEALFHPLININISKVHLMLPIKNYSIIIEFVKTYNISKN